MSHILRTNSAIMTRGKKHKASGWPGNYSFYLLGPWWKEKWKELTSFSQQAGVREDWWKGAAWDTPLCILLTSVHAVETTLGKEKKTVKYLLVIISNIWKLSYGHWGRSQKTHVRMSDGQERVKILKFLFGLVGYIWILRIFSWFTNYFLWSI